MRVCSGSVICVSYGVPGVASRNAVTLDGYLNFSGFDGQSLKFGVTAIHGYYSYLGLLERSLRFRYGKAPFDSNSSHKCLL